jgi:hypothetical protein
MVCSHHSTHAINIACEGPQIFFLRLGIPSPPNSFGLHTVSQITLRFPPKNLSQATQRKAFLIRSSNTINLHEGLNGDLEHSDEIYGNACEHGLHKSCSAGHGDMLSHGTSFGSHFFLPKVENKFSLVF